MLEVNVTIKCPDLVLAATALAAALGKKPTEAAAVPQQITAPAAVPQQTTAAPVVTAPTAPLVTAPAAPVAPAPTTAPTAAPTYTLAQVATAGATLMSQHPETQEALMGLLGQFGIKAVSELKPDQFPAFAAELRRLGAKL